ncbi:YtxH domain-containing protein [Flavobacterium sp. j3]|uniref:YtxH domain-containing protein n=1 Tax=Flavobacterium aureirubrum TaxID=3133147 RepID=A0ABU9N6Q0_9FLAO
MKNNDVLLGILGGVAVGAVLGVLFAPAKGSETRKKIANTSVDFKDSIKESLENFSEKIAQTINGLKDEANEIIADAKDIIDEEKVNFDNLKEMNKSKTLS